MSARKGIDRTILTIAVLGSLVLLNVVSLRYFARLDLTRDQRFSLSDATHVTLEELKDPVTVRAYFTADLPAPFSTNSRYVRDLLEEYHAGSDGQVQFEFIDPVSEETAADKEKKKEVKKDIFGRTIRESTSVEQEMEQLGIPPVQVQVNEDDKIEVKRAYMGIAVNYGDETEIIPMVQTTDGLEYDLTTLIRKLTREKAPKVAIVGGHDGETPREDLGQLRGLIGQLYEVVDVDLTTSEIPEDVTAVLVIGPRTPLSEDEQKKLDRFIASGKSAAFLLDVMKADFSKLTSEDVDHGLTDLIAGYGVKIEPGLVIDAESATISVAQQRGFMRIMQPVQYPFIPQPKSLSADHPLTRGISDVVFPFMSPLEVNVPAEGPVDADVIVKSSPKSWVQQKPYDLNPMQQWTASADEAGARNLVVALSGKLPPHFPDSVEEGKQPAEGRIAVVGGSSFVGDQFLSAGNRALVLNLLDWLLLDDALLAVRTRGLDAAPLVELDERQKTTIRWVNVLGVPLLLVAFGVVRWRMRERRRALVHV
ncbi:MAG: ABC transporter permease [Deltaproteobacteria bacterium]|nr:ABC transporter permease [Deltaproteobacteria bacterium]